MIAYNTHLQDSRHGPEVGRLAGPEDSAELTPDVRVVTLLVIHQPADRGGARPVLHEPRDHLAKALLVVGRSLLHLLPRIANVG